MRHERVASARRSMPARPLDRMASRGALRPLVAAGLIAPILFAGAAALAAGAGAPASKPREARPQDAGAAPIIPLAARPDLAPLGDAALGGEVPVPALPEDPEESDLFLAPEPRQPTMRPFLEVPGLAREPAGAASSPDRATSGPDAPVGSLPPGSAPLR